MLLRFSTRNYRSLATEQEIVLTASRLDDNADGLISVDGLKNDVLPVIAIYGANASGKSNLLKAIQFLVGGVRESYKTPLGQKINRKQFLLSDCENGKSTNMEIDFIVRNTNVGDTIKNVRFTYGFIITDENVAEEWLYSYPSGHRQVWFHRNRSETPEFHFGRELKGQNRVTAELTRPEVLFLSSAFVNNHQQLTPIYEFITNGILIRLGDLSFDDDSSLVGFLEKDALREKLLNFLRNADTGICTAQVTEEEIPQAEVDIRKAVSSALQKHFDKKENTLTSSTRKRVRLGHTGSSGPVFFALSEESRGTLAFLELMGLVILALEVGSILIVDEFDSSLHPILSKQVIGLFNSKKSNPNGAQLIFSTHDASILSREILRRDQIYFVEKDTVGRSIVYPLTALKTKKSDNIQKGYLEGRFGAIPFLGDFEALVGNENGQKTS
jgi:AAA15 family ATPase/GTPase